MKKNVTRKQFEDAVVAYQFKHFKFNYLRTKSSVKFTPAHKFLEFVMANTFNSDIVILKGVTYIFFTCEGYVDLSDIFQSPDKKGTLFVIEKTMTTDEFEEFFDKLINSKYMTDVMNRMSKEFHDMYKSDKAA